MNPYIVALLKASFLSILLYWGLDYRLDYTFWLGSLMFFIVFLGFAYVISKENKSKEIKKC